jgi:hypothetical protein
MADEIVEPTTPPADAVPVVETSAPKPERNKGDERFSELTYRLRQAEATIAKLSEPKPVEKPALIEPTLEQSGYDEVAHKAALKLFDEQRIERLAEEKVERALAARDAKTKAEQLDNSFSSKLGKLSKEERDLAMTAKVTDVTAKLIKKSDVGVELLQHLAANEELAENIARLDPEDQAMEIGALAATLRKAVETPKPVAVSKAPPPAAKLEAVESVAIDKDPKDMTDAEYAKWRRKQIAQRR